MRGMTERELEAYKQYDENLSKGSSKVVGVFSEGLPKYQLKLVSPSASFVTFA